MKFFALALSVLLAVGCQAASLQADAPSQLDQVRGVVSAYLAQLKESSKRAVAEMGLPEEYRTNYNQRLDDLQAALAAVQAQVAPMTNSFVTTVLDATTDVRANIENDYNTMMGQLQPQKDELYRVLNQHFEQYRAKLEPLVREYLEKYKAEGEAMKERMRPLIEELSQTVSTNIEETKTALHPITTAVSEKIQERLGNLKDMADPYVKEYQEQFRSFTDQAGQVDSAKIQDLKTKITPLFEDIRVKLQAIAAAVGETFSQN